MVQYILLLQFYKISLGAAWLHYKQNAWSDYNIDRHVKKSFLNIILNM